MTTIRPVPAIGPMVDRPYGHRVIDAALLQILAERREKREAAELVRLREDRAAGLGRSVDEVA
jgi:hypothetical protein